MEATSTRWTFLPFPNLLSYQWDGLTDVSAWDGLPASGPKGTHLRY